MLTLWYVKTWMFTFITGDEEVVDLINDVMAEVMLQTALHVGVKPSRPDDDVGWYLGAIGKTEAIFGIPSGHGV
jgi:hypothetical protein